MKQRRRYLIAGMLLLTAGLTLQASAQRFSVRAEFSGGDPAYSVYFSTLSGEYGVPYSEICMMRDAGVVREDIPVILYIHQHSPYSLRQIYSLRLRGASWANLSNWCGVPLYFENGRCSVPSGPPYGNAYGYYGHGNGRGHGKHWRAMYDDDDRGR